MLRMIEQIPQLPVSAKRIWSHYLVDSLLALVGALGVTAIIYVFHLYPTIPNISIVYLLIILGLASTRGRYAALLAAIVAFISFDFFLVPPFYSFTIARWEEWLALFVFLVTALLTSQLAIVMRQSLEDARLREREARILYEVGRIINGVGQVEDQLESIVLAFVRVFSSWGVRECALLLPDSHGTLTVQADAPIRVESFTLSDEEMATARAVMERGEMIERRALDSQAASMRQGLILRMIPLKTGDQVFGVLCLRIEPGVSWFASHLRLLEEQERPTDRSTFFWTFLDQAILVIERAQLRSQTVANNG
ncbi:MAG TPA: DUF4118 domain-containing protein [Ktedonobacteraceae bacterium]|nr:DUF4118 domain-containing protein [Ktedonobacteraceae bacterium]